MMAIPIHYLFSIGAFPVSMNKFTEKAIIDAAVSAAVGRTCCTKTLVYGNTVFMEIASHIPVIFPDAVCFFAGLVWLKMIYNDWNYLHLYRVLSRAFYRIYPKKQFLKQNLKQWY
jgi:hypothetical protein